MTGKSTLETINDCIDSGSIGFMYDYQKNVPMLTFVVSRDFAMQLTYPDSHPILNPVSFEPVYNAYIFTNNSFFGRLSDHEYNIVISRVEDQLGKSIDQITFGTMGYFERDRVK